jgi:protein-S-isoprenylcysteine O-methyltransferase Ste14
MTANPPLQFAFWTLLSLTLLVRVFFAARVRRGGDRLMPDRAAIQREGVGLFAARAVLFFLLLGLLAAYAVNPPWLRALTFALPAWLRWLGFLAGLLSVTLLAWTEAALGRHWSAQLQLRKGHRLVTSGPYSRIRHPLYTAMFGFGVSLALVSASWPIVAMVVAMVWGLALRVPREEDMLIEEFGNAYRDYMKRTGRFWPR